MMDKQKSKTQLIYGTPLPKQDEKYGSFFSEASI